MRPTKLFLSLAAATVFIISCKDEQNENLETDPIEFRKEGELLLLRANGDTINQLDIEIADNAYERETGLMYRENIEEDQGMLFVYDEERQRSFYMKNTQFPLDLIFYSSDSTAVSFQKNAEAYSEETLPSEKPAQFILEINAGLSDEWNLEIGHKIDFKRIDQ